MLFVLWVLGLCFLFLDKIIGEKPILTQYDLNLIIPAKTVFPKTVQVTILRGQVTMNFEEVDTLQPHIRRKFSA